jgi:CBS domain-containing protein
MKIETILASKGPRVVTVAPGATLRQAVHILAGEGVGALVVVDDGPRPVGILSERDLIRYMDRDPASLAATVADVMTRDVVCGTLQDEAEAVLRTMTERHFRHMPILDGDRLAGIVSLGDIVKAQLLEYRGEVETLQAELTAD